MVMLCTQNTQPTVDFPNTLRCLEFLMFLSVKAIPHFSSLYSTTSHSHSPGLALREGQ